MSANRKGPTFLALSDDASAKSRRLTPTEVKVFHRLTRIADVDGGNCFPSVARLCEQLGMRQDRVRAHLRKLEEKGWIERVPLVCAESGRQVQNAYFLRVPESEPGGPIFGARTLTNLRKVRIATPADLGLDGGSGEQGPVAERGEPMKRQIRQPETTYPPATG